MKRLALLAALLFVTFTGDVRADDEDHPMPASYTNTPALNALASHWARRPVTVGCATDTEEWDADFQSAGSWGYTWLDTDWTGIYPGLCSAALEAGEENYGGVDPWRVAIAIQVITHESWHLRLWLFRSYEDEVECKALKSFRKSAKLLGSSQEQADELYSWAWAFHQRLGVLFPEYAKRNCGAPRPSITWLRANGWTWNGGD